MISVRSALLAIALLCASVAHADSDGVPFVDGEWTGRIKAVYYDQTSEGSNSPKQKYKDKVEVAIDQEDGDLDIDIVFQNGLPAVSGGAITSLELDGDIGNFHLSIVQSDISPVMVGSGKVSKKGNRMIIRGIAASGDFTHEFVMKLKRRGG